MQERRGLAIALAVLLVAIVVGLMRGYAPAERPKARAQAVNATLKRQTASDECAGNTASKAVLVSISAQHMWACQSTEMVKQSAVTTGATDVPNGVDDATPVGTWRIYEKFRNLVLKGSDANGAWDDYVQYWMPFDTAVGFHDASWQTFPFGSSRYKTDGSHGCVQLPTDIAAWLYSWAPVGTRVVVTA
jgi:hypothetical protein